MHREGDCAIADCCFPHPPPSPLQPPSELNGRALSVAGSQDEQGRAAWANQSGGARQPESAGSHLATTPCVAAGAPGSANHPSMLSACAVNSHHPPPPPPPCPKPRRTNHGHPTPPEGASRKAVPESRERITLQAAEIIDPPSRNTPPPSPLPIRMPIPSQPTRAAQCPPEGSALSEPSGLGLDRALFITSGHAHPSSVHAPLCPLCCKLRPARPSSCRAGLAGWH